MTLYRGWNVLRLPSPPPYHNSLALGTVYSVAAFNTKHHYLTAQREFVSSYTHQLTMAICGTTLPWWIVVIGHVFLCYSSFGGTWSFLAKTNLIFLLYYAFVQR